MNCRKKEELEVCMKMKFSLATKTGVIVVGSLKLGPKRVER